MHKISTLFAISLLGVSGAFAQNGSLDTSFNHDGIAYHTQVNALNRHPRTVQRLLVMPDSTILLGCQSETNVDDPLGYNGLEFCRLDKYGTVLDTIPCQYSCSYLGYRTIGIPNGWAADGNGVRDMTLLPNGKVLVTAGIETNQGNYTETTLCLNYPNLSVDSTYGINGVGQPWQGAYIQIPNKCALAPDGSSYTVGNGYLGFTFDTSYAFLIKRKPNGMLDSSWQDNGVFKYSPELGGTLNDVRVAADGSIYVCGVYKDYGTVFNAVIMKLHPDGSVDAVYGNNGVATNQYIAYSMALNADGSTYMNGEQYSDNSYIAKYKPNGTLDSTFGINGRNDVPSHPPGQYTEYGANDMLVQPDGKLVMIGVGLGIYDSSWVAAWRVLPNGNMDSTFGTNGIANYHIMPDTIPVNFPTPILRTAYCGAMQPDGKILMGGWFAMGNASYGEMVVMRLDNTIVPEGIAKVQNDMQLQAYPIPAGNTLTLRYQLRESDALAITLTDVNGKAVVQKNMGKQAAGMHDETLNLPKLATGIYLLQVQGATHKECMQLLVK